MPHPLQSLWLKVWRMQWNEQRRLLQRLLPHGMISCKPLRVCDHHRVCYLSDNFVGGQLGLKQRHLSPKGDTFATVLSKPVTVHTIYARWS